MASVPEGRLLHEVRQKSSLAAALVLIIWIFRDRFGKTPLDYAHPWLAGELKEIMAQRERVSGCFRVLLSFFVSFFCVH